MPAPYSNAEPSRRMMDGAAGLENIRRLWHPRRTRSGATANFGPRRSGRETGLVGAKFTPLAVRAGATVIARHISLSIFNSNGRWPAEKPHTIIGKVFCSALLGPLHQLLPTSRHDGIGRRGYPHLSPPARESTVWRGRKSSSGQCRTAPHMVFIRYHAQ